MKLVFYILILCGWVSQIDSIKNVLAIGNSLTSQNCYPCKVKSFYNKNNKGRISVSKSVKNGVPLIFHSTYEPTLKKLNQRNNYAIVLQEQSDTISRFPYDSKAVQYFSSKHNNVYIIESWAHRTYKYPEYQNKALLNVRSLARKYNIKYIPVGTYWFYLWIVNRQMWTELYKDDRHPSAMGSYFTACLVYKHVFNVTNISDNYRPRNLDKNKRKYLLSICNE